MKYALWVALEGVDIYELSKINITTLSSWLNFISFIKEPTFYLVDPSHMFINPLISTLSKSILLMIKFKTYIKLERMNSCITIMQLQKFIAYSYSYLFIPFPYNPIT